MHQILKATIEHAKILSEIAIPSFLNAHGHSAPKKDIDNYIAKNFEEENFITELKNPENYFYIITYKDKIAGYSKIILNSKNEAISDKKVTQMSRLYLLEEFYGFNLGKELFNFNVAFSKQNNQNGIWLNVWVENLRAIKFYKRSGFKIIGKSNFKISETHYNPNHIMYLEL